MLELALISELSNIQLWREPFHFHVSVGLTLALVASPRLEIHFVALRVLLKLFEAGSFTL